MLEEGADIIDVAEALGHANLASVRHYARYTPSVWRRPWPGAPTAVAVMERPKPPPHIGGENQWAGWIPLCPWEMCRHAVWLLGEQSRN